MILRKYQMTRNRQERIDIDLDDNVLDPEVLVPGESFQFRRSNTKSYVISVLIVKQHKR